MPSSGDSDQMNECCHATFDPCKLPNFTAWVFPSKFVLVYALVSVYPTLVSCQWERVRTWGVAIWNERMPLSTGQS